MFADANLLPISALQHLLFCERQCALIHVERLWAENRLTIEGRQLHKKAHDPGKHLSSSRSGVRIARGLELTSHRLGLFGVSDVVEFPAGETGQPPLPIEYKRGQPKKNDADKVQLCAQAMCLEEMLQLPPGIITHGQIFYGRTRRRLEVPLDTSLRCKTEQASIRLHEIIDAGFTPPARREKQCDRCSLLHLCLPDALRPRRTARVYLTEAATIALMDQLNP
ncbi:MAG: CRISPR-associated protein Cas4 [Phycisphaeraceae bacterium]|nr:CRISPR-associated protein Cas4 [Phycisphaeraceae bacterium]